MEDQDVTAAESNAAVALAPLRRQIDTLDEEIVRLLAARFDVVRQVAAMKAETGIPVRLPGRIEAVCGRAAELGARHDLDPAFMRRLYRQIIDEACAMEDRQIGSSDGEA